MQSKSYGQLELQLTSIIASSQSVDSMAMRMDPGLQSLPLGLCGFDTSWHEIYLNVGQ
jgi:hypothetical protein